MNYIFNVGGDFVEFVLQKILVRILRKKLSVGGDLYLDDFSVQKDEQNMLKVKANVSLLLSQNDILNLLEKAGLI